MNILVVSEVGPDLTGPRNLAAAWKAKGKNPRLTIMVPAEDGATAGLALGRVPTPDEIEKVGQEEYIIPALPLDLIDFAFLHSEAFLNRGSWDMVCVGISEGRPAGMEVYRHNAIMMGWHASVAYQTPAYVVTQQAGPVWNKRHESLVTQFQGVEHPSIGEVIHINFPPGEPKAVMRTVPAHYQPTRLPPTSLVPRAHGELSDATYMADGFVTMTRIEPRIQVSLRW